MSFAYDATRGGYIDAVSGRMLTASEIASMGGPYAAMGGLGIYAEQLQQLQQIRLQQFQQIRLQQYAQQQNAWQNQSNNFGLGHQGIHDHSTFVTGTGTASGNPYQIDTRDPAVRQMHARAEADMLEKASRPARYPAADATPEAWLRRRVDEMCWKGDRATC